MPEKLSRLPSTPTLESVAAKLCDLGNYGATGSLKSRIITSRTNQLLGFEIFDDGNVCASSPEIPEIPKEKLAKASKYLSAVLAEYRSGPDYLALKYAYDHDDQKNVKILVPKIFPGVKVDHRNPRKHLFHGIIIENHTTPEENFALAMKIMSDGYLLPSPHGVHHSMDENIRPVFTVVDPEETHGLLFFEFAPAEHGYIVFDPEFQAERLIYSPKMRIPMKLFLKSEAFFEQELKMAGFSTSNGIEFRNKLHSMLVESNVGFELAHPTEYQRFH